MGRILRACALTAAVSTALLKAGEALRPLAASAPGLRVAGSIVGGDTDHEIRTSRCSPTIATVGASRSEATSHTPGK